MLNANATDIVGNYAFIGLSTRPLRKSLSLKVNLFLFNFIFFVFLVQICDAVAVAGLLNATLVIPIFHLNSVWRDSR